MNQVSYDNTFGMVDLKVFSELMAEDNSENISRLKKNLITALKHDITPLQRTYIIEYYGQCLTMQEIAERHGVNKSTVSRTIARGRRRLQKFLKYGMKNLLEQANS